MEKERIHQIFLYLLLWLFLIIDFGLGMWRAVIYISATLVLYFEALSKREIDWIMWLKIYGVLLAYIILKRALYKDLPSVNLGSRFQFF